jgi:hypothetical protein
MAMGLPSREEIRAYLISQGMPPEAAERRAADAERNANRQALTTSLLGALTPAGGVSRSAAPAAEGIVGRAMGFLRNLGSGPSYQPVRMGSGQVRNLAASAPRVVRMPDGAIVKLAPGNPVPAGAVVLNAAEAPIGAITAGIAGGVGAPALLAGRPGEPGERDGSLPSVVDPMGNVAIPGGGLAPAAAPAAAAPAAAAPAADLPDPGAEPATTREEPRPLTVRPAARAPVPLPPRRPADLREAPRMANIPMEYQSTRGSVVQRDGGTRLNWGDSDLAADFIRADRAKRALEQAGETYSGMSAGGAADGKPHKDAAIMKALEIIHHMLRSR